MRSAGIRDLGATRGFQRPASVHTGWWPRGSATSRSSMTRSMNPIADVGHGRAVADLRRERPNVLHIDPMFTAVHGTDA